MLGFLVLAASRLQARYRRLRDAIGTGEIGLHFAIGKPLKGFCALVRCESSGTTETHATGPGALPAFACTVGFKEPDDVSIAVAVEANDTFIDRLKAISEAAQGHTLDQE